MIEYHDTWDGVDYFGELRKLESKDLQEQIEKLKEIDTKGKPELQVQIAEILIRLYARLLSN